MKIQINENEKYEILIPEEVNSQEFFGIIERLSFIQKLLIRNPFLVTTTTNTKQQRIRPKYIDIYNMTNKEEYIEFLQAWKNNDKEKLNLLRTKYNWNDKVKYYDIWRKLCKTVRNEIPEEYKRKKYLVKSIPIEEIYNIVSNYYCNREKFNEWYTNTGYATTPSQIIYALIKKHNISPDEVGLIRFPKRGEKNYEHLLINKEEKNAGIEEKKEEG